MQAVIRSNAFVHSIAIVAFIFSICNVAAESESNIQLNEDALAFAAKLIKEGRSVADHKGAWIEHRPSADEENGFIRLHGFAAYAKWHLGIDKRFPEHTKRRYKFAYGDFKDAHRCGLLAVKARARQYSYLEIENAATNLERLIEGSKSGALAVHSQNIAVTANIDLSFASARDRPSNSSLHVPEQSDGSVLAIAPR